MGFCGWVLFARTRFVIRLRFSSSRPFAFISRAQEIGKLERRDFMFNAGQSVQWV